MKQYTISIIIGLMSILFISISVRAEWPNYVKIVIKYAIPILVFIALSLHYVLTNENVTDTVAKWIFCRFYEFPACAVEIHQREEVRLRELARLPEETRRREEGKENLRKMEVYLREVFEDLQNDFTRRKR